MAMRARGIASVVACVACALCAACSREPCEQLDRYWGGPEAWRRHEVAPEPRCRAEDPSCGPEPALTVEPACYRPASARERLPPGEPPTPRSSSACTHDGECQLAGNCGTACVGYRERDFIATCMSHDWLDERAFCGCVEGACSFFRQ
jgi:hypothetical protein